MTITPNTPSIDELRTRVCDRSTKTGRRRSPKHDWTPPTLEDFAQDQNVLAFDQALVNTGWALLRTEPEGVRLLATGTIKTKSHPHLTGLRYTFDQLDQIHRQLQELRDQFLNRTYVTVGEYPNVGGGYRTDASMMAAREIHRLFPTTRWVSNTHARAVLAGPQGKESKRELHNTLVQHLIELPRRWNEHQRDAVALGMTYLYDLKAHA